MTSPRKSILNIEGYDIPLFLDEYKLKLDLNENTMGPSPKVINALQNITAEDIKYYPAYGDVVNKLASFNNIDPDMILQANGADEAINYIFDTFVEQDDKVLAVTPSFVMPKIYANILGCTYQEINYTEKFEFPIEEILKNIDEKTKLIIVTSPNNPTGEAISSENMLKVLEVAKEKYILIDETYVSYGEKSFIDLVKKHPNIFITRSMSKDFGLAGLRFGYIISNKENIIHIKKAIKPYSVNIAAVKAALAALDDIEYLNYVVSQVRESKQLLTEGLKELAVKVYPSNANFLLVDFGEKADFVYKKLLNAGIKVKNCGKTKHLENCLRITLPAVEDTKYILESLKPRDLIIFDVDGVLVDIRNSYRMAIKETYRHFSGKDISPKEIQQAKNIGGLNNDWDLTEYLLKNSGIMIPKNQIIDKFQELYFGNNGDGFILNEKLLISPEIIKNLAKDYDLAIFTGRPKQEAEFVLKRWKLEDYFYSVIAMEDLSEGQHKPEPDGLLKILNIASPKNAYYLGDTHDDMISAKKAGVKAIGVLPPQDKSPELKEKLIEYGAEEVLLNTEDLIKLLNGENNYANSNS
ncbi:MAG: histidinol-phosphate transaminase [Candidatus Melainabacteria bacterium GWA2_34_9]|nr:MAG: histidinol-phosphate transaminase [Candidatus Melainabacteria bacterium GWA2_34_9]